MTILDILNFLNLTQLGNTIFYPLLTILPSNCVALSLSFRDPKSRYVYIFTSIPKIVSIICISMNALWQLSNVIDSPFLFQAFILVGS
jgi:hypothetical protein